MDGYLTELRRTKIGKLNINEAFSIENISTLSSDKRKSCIKPTEVLVDRYPKLSLLDSEVDFIKNGQPIKCKKKLNTEIYTLFTKSKAFIGLGKIDSNNLLKVVRLISTNIN